MNSVLALCMLAVLAIGGQAADGEGPKPCCAPDTWLATIKQKCFYNSATSATFGYGEAYTEEAWDVPNKRIAYRISGIGDGYYKRYVVDYDKLESYSITKDTCVKEKFKAFAPMGPACIPSDGKYDGHYKLGVDEMKLDVWGVSYPGVSGEIDVTSDTCIAVFSTLNINVAGQYNVKLESTNFNVSKTISDKSIFDVPSNCADGQLTFDGHRLDVFGLQIYYGSAPYVMGKETQPRVNRLTRYNDKYLRF